MKMQSDIGSGNLTPVPARTTQTLDFVDRWNGARTVTVPAGTLIERTPDGRARIPQTGLISSVPFEAI